MQPLFRLAYLRQMGREEMIAFLTVGASAAFTFQNVQPFSLQFWIALLTLVFFAIGLLTWWNPHIQRQQKQQIIYIMVGLGCLMFIVSESTFSASILFFILSAAVMEFFPTHRGYSWILA